MSRPLIAALLVMAGLSGCGGPAVPDRATSETQVRQRMAEYNLMQITPGSGARMCSYMVGDAREAWKEDDSDTAAAMRDLLPPSVVDCESHREHLIGVITGSPKAVELIRTDQVTQVQVDGERATATLGFGGTFEWRWEDGEWLMNRHL